jgi:cell division protein FtsW (lipid II flippase)
MVWVVRTALAGQWLPHYAWPAVVFAAVLVAMRVSLAIIGFRGDMPLLTIALLLSGLGLAIQFRFGTLALQDPMRWSNYALPIGAAAALATIAVFRGPRARLLEAASVPMAMLAVAILGAMLVFGQRFRGALYLQGYLNPTEIVKVLLVVYAAHLLRAFRKNFEQPVLPGIPAPSGGLLLSLGAFWAAPMFLLIGIRDLGMIALLNGTLIAMATLMTGRWGYLLSGLLAMVAAGVAVWTFLPHGAGRLAVWLDPFADPTGRGWQVLQGLSAMASGGWWGAGLGAGNPSAVPIAASDFVYAAIGEELGFIGCGLVLSAFLMLFHRGYRLADSLRDPFQQALATGLTTILALQTLFHVGGVTKALPLTGLTLPFISHGGSSLITSFVLLGLLLALSDQSKK